MRIEKNLEIYGEAEYCFLTKPDTFFDAKKGKYTVTLKVPKAKSGELIREINEVIKSELIASGKNPESFPGETKKPYTVEGDMVLFKTKSEFKPVLWDVDGQKIDENVNVWKGSTMWVKCKASGYNKYTGIGATLLLGGVQIDKLVEGTGEGPGSCPFPKRTRSALKPFITERVLPVKEVI